MLVWACAVVAVLASGRSLFVSFPAQQVRPSPPRGAADEALLSQAQPVFFGGTAAVGRDTPPLLQPRRETGPARSPAGIHACAALLTAALALRRPRATAATDFPAHSRRLHATFRPATSGRASSPRLNLLGDVFDDKLKEQKPPDRPLYPTLVRSAASVYHLQEKLFSFSGEDFSVKDIAGEEVINISGGNVNLGGVVIDKLAFKDPAGNKFCSVERRIVAASTCYDIYNPDGSECIAKVEREWLSMTPKYQFYYEGDANPFGDFYAEGSFSDRTYTFKSGGPFGETIARVRRAPEVFQDVDGYAVEVAAGVDAAAIIAVAVIIDEDHDEEDAKREREGEEKKEGGLWPFG